MHFKTLYSVQCGARVVAQHVHVAGPRGGVPDPGGGAPGGARVPDQHQDQHLLLGQGAQAQLQEEEVPDQAPPRGLRKWTVFRYLAQGVRERARVPQLVMLCRWWAHLQCFAGHTSRTHGTTAGYCVAGKRAQYRNIRPQI